MTHDEASELLAALALDAVEVDERTAIEEHVAQCPRCQAELDALREVASAMGNSVEALPQDLWGSISSRIYEDQSGETREAPLLLVGPRDGTSRANGDDRALSRSKSKIVVSAFSALAAAVIAVLAISLASANGHVSRLNNALASETTSEVHAALVAPDHRVVDLTSASNQDVAQFVLLPDGRGFLVKSTLPTLSSDKTYQLWAIINGKPISVGLMGHQPTAVTFTVSGNSVVTALDVTVEPSGGTSTPTSPVVASATV
ncbi:MAG: anti-sigma factor [Acidimicrobiales bacterium]|jgi:anti-sigma-K factor RskA